MSKSATLRLEKQEIELPIIVGTENERAVDISKLRASTGYITLDEGYVNTGSVTSAIASVSVLSPPVIVNQPTDQVVGVGGTADDGWGVARGRVEPTLWRA